MLQGDSNRKSERPGTKSWHMAATLIGYRGTPMIERDDGMIHLDSHHQTHTREWPPLFSQMITWLLKYHV